MRCNNILDAIGRTPLVRLNRINQGLKQTMTAVLDASLGYEVASSLLPAHREGVTAFLEKRHANFSNND